MFSFNKEKRNYKKILDESLFPIQREINKIPEKEIRKFFNILLDITEKILRSILFIKNPFNFDKNLNKKDLIFWFENVSLFLIVYSFYCVEIVKKFYNLKIIYLGEKSSLFWFHDIYNYYNRIFDKKINQNNIDYLASGYKEDIEKGYSQNKNKIKTNEMLKKDIKTISSILLEGIWNEKFLNNENKGYFLGGRILDGHRQVVRPFLEKLAKGNMQKYNLMTED